MKANKKFSSVVLATVTAMVIIARPLQLSAHTPSQGSTSGASQWSVQVNKVEPGDVNLGPAFQVAIYEDLLDELSKTKRFRQVFRSGDRNASAVPDLLILKTTVQKYSPGSETQRAVTTVSGATKLNVRSQLCTRDGRTILEREVNGNVRFFGSNLRATHNLARNVAKTIKESSLPEPSTLVPAPRKETSSVAAEQPPPIRTIAARVK
jgi:hypothetical protein